MFNEENTVEKMVLESLSQSSIGWEYMAHQEIPRNTSDVFVESMVRDALVRLNSEISEDPQRADEVIYKLRTMPMGVQGDGLVRANEAFTEWLRNEKTMPFGENNEHTEVKLTLSRS